MKKLFKLLITWPKFSAKEFLTSYEYYTRGIEKTELQDYKGAIADYTKAIKIDSENALAYFKRGAIKDYLKDFKGAITDYTKAIMIDPKNALSYIGRGRAKATLEDYKGATEDYTKAIKIEPKNGYIYYCRGFSKAKLEDYKGAVLDCSKFIEINPNDFDAYFNRGTFKILSRDYEGAIADFDAVIEINPFHTEAFYRRGMIKIEMGQKYSGNSDLEKAKSFKVLDFLKNSNAEIKMGDQTLFKFGNDLGERLMKVKGSCLKCSNIFTFEEGVNSKRNFGIDDKEKVVMCPKCGAIFTLDMNQSKMTMIQDVSNKFRK
jgi:tetratricopeptide (TPR) repeat protein